MKITWRKADSTENFAVYHAYDEDGKLLAWSIGERYGDRVDGWGVHIVGRVGAPFGDQPRLKDAKSIVADYFAKQVA